MYLNDINLSKYYHEKSNKGLIEPKDSFLRE
jgi:hypothetical protein